MQTLTAHPKTEEQVKALIALFKAWDIPYEPEESPYDPEFVKMVKETRKQAKEGKLTKLTSEELDKTLAI